ncbi:MAG TPA: hypothetical protein VER34_24350 [Mycobacterium sp.]|jgi:hypothetical protein|nr:hypothetical protein [Mycobacterium sp.]
MTEPVDDATVPVAVELVLRGPLELEGVVATLNSQARRDAMV